MKISARNALPGKIVDIKKGATTAHVRIDVQRHDCDGLDHQRIRCDELGLKAGDQVHARIANLNDGLSIHRPQDLKTLADGLRRAGLPE